MDNRHLSPKELSVFKIKIVEAVEEGFSQAHVSKLFGFTPTTVSKYIRDYKKRGKESFEVVARGRKIGKLEEAEIQETIDKKTPDEVGLDCVLWTRKAVREYIDKKYKVEYAVRSMTDVLTRWGFTPQKPLKIAMQKDPIRVQKWLDEGYVQIKKQAIEEGASIFWKRRYKNIVSSCPCWGYGWGQGIASVVESLRGAYVFFGNTIDRHCRTLH